MGSRYWVGNSGVWDALDASHWADTSGGAPGATAPTASDDVVLDNNTGSTDTPLTITLGVDASCKSLQFNGPTVVINCQGLYPINVAGSVKLFRASVVDPPALGAFVITSDCTFVSLGVDACGVVIAGGTTTLADGFWCSGALICTSTGTLDTAGQAVTIGRFKSDSAGAATVLNGSVVTVTGTGTAWDFTAGALSAGTSTIKFTDASAAGRTFRGGGKTYHDVWFAGAYTGTLDILGSNTFNDLRSDAGLHIVRFAAGSTQVVGTLTLGGSGVGSTTTLKSDVDGAAWYLSCPSGSIVCEWLVLKDSHASGGASFAATSSLDSGGNSGWSIVAPVPPVVGDRRVRLTYLRR